MVNVPPFSPHSRWRGGEETCKLLIPFQGLGADLITLSLLNCHLTGENHSCQHALTPFLHTQSLEKLWKIPD